MVLNYITSYFSTLMILFMLLVIMFVNRKSQIPAAALFRTCVVLIFVISVFDFMDQMTTGGCLFSSYRSFPVFLSAPAGSGVCQAAKPR